MGKYYDDKNKSRHNMFRGSVKMILIITIFILGYAIIKQFKNKANKPQIEYNSIK